MRSPFGSRAIRPYDGLTFAIYPRVSTEEQESNESLDTQTKNCKRLIAQLGAPEVPNEYIFQEDESGMKLERPELTKLRQFIRDRVITAIIVNDSSRLSRRPGHGEELLDEMAKYGCRFFIAMHGREFDLDNPSDRQMLTMEFAFNRQWHYMLIYNMKAGKRNAAEGGSFVASRVKYGLTRERLPGGDIAVRLIEEEAAVVKSMFDWFTYDGLGVSKIQKQLTGIPTPVETGRFPRKSQRNPGEWSQSTIYEILRSPVYKGTYTLYVDSKEFDPIEHTIPAIVDEETWLMAQARLDEGKQTSFRNTSHPYLMARRMRCDCGYTMQIMHSQKKNGWKKIYYICATRKSKENSIGARDKPCIVPTFPQEETDAVVWGWLVDKIRDPDGLEKILMQAKEDADKINAPIHRRLTQLADIERAQEGKVELLLGGVKGAADARMKAMLERLLKETGRTYKEVAKERAEITVKLADTAISDEFIRRWRDNAAVIKEGADQFTFEEKLEYIQVLNIKATCAFEEGQRILYIHLYSYRERVPLATNSETRSHNEISCKILTVRLVFAEALRAYALQLS